MFVVIRKKTLELSVRASYQNIDPVVFVVKLLGLLLGAGLLVSPFFLPRKVQPGGLGSVRLTFV